MILWERDSQILRDWVSLTCISESPSPDLGTALEQSQQQSSKLYKKNISIISSRAEWEEEEEEGRTVINCKNSLLFSGERGKGKTDDLSSRVQHGRKPLDGDQRRRRGDQ